MDGLYLTTDKLGVLKRTLVSGEKKILLEDTTVEDEIINFSELNFEPYASVVEQAQLLSEEIEDMEPDSEHFGEVDIEKYNRLVNLAYDLAELLEEENPLHGVLIRLMLQDNIPVDDGTAMCVFRSKYTIVACLEEIMRFHVELSRYLDDAANNRIINLQEDYPRFTYVEAKYIFTMSETGAQITQRFRSISEYYLFLLQKFIQTNPNICFCRCCGRYFIPKTKKKTLYCDRIVRNGMTCKQIAPKLKHEKLKQNDELIKAYERVKNKMYKRAERTETMGLDTEKSMSYTEYYDWQERASKARNAYLCGELSKEDALKIIKSE